MVLKIWKLRFCVCHKGAVWVYYLMENPLIANSAEVLRLDSGGVKIAKIERKVQAPR
jgi:hypothetical protein